MVDVLVKKPNYKRWRFAKKTCASVLPGFCASCGDYSIFVYDQLYSPDHRVNWRERLVCKKCGLNNRQRLCAYLLRHVARSDHSDADLRIYATEQVTPFGFYLKKEYPDVVLSEYLGDEARKGEVNKHGVLHQDVTDLTFSDSSFDVVLSFDVLEHVPDYSRALLEFYRVLRPSGALFLTLPFKKDAQENVIRARLLDDGSVEHYLPAEFHGDPVNPDGGVLCFYHFGWQLLDELTSAGFEDVFVSLNWSIDYAHIGPEQLVIIARKSNHR